MARSLEFLRIPCRRLKFALSFQKRISLFPAKAYILHCPTKPPTRRVQQSAAQRERGADPPQPVMPKLIQGSCIHPDIGENPTQVHVLPTPVHQDATGTGNLPRRLQPAMPFFNRDTVRFVGVSFQFGLLVLLIRQFELERGPLGDVMLLAWIGFAIHHFLPGRLRFRCRRLPR